MNKDVIDYVGLLLIGAFLVMIIAGGIYYMFTGIDAPFCTEWKWPRARQ